MCGACSTVLARLPFWAKPPSFRTVQLLNHSCSTLRVIGPRRQVPGLRGCSLQSARCRSVDYPSRKISGERGHAVVAKLRGLLYVKDRGCGRAYYSNVLGITVVCAFFTSPWTGQRPWLGYLCWQFSLAIYGSTYLNIFLSWTVHTTTHYSLTLTIYTI